MPTFVKRIIVLLLTVTLLVFAYEHHYVSKTIETTGTIESITLKGRGREMTVGFVLPAGGRSAFTSDILIFDEFSGKYQVGGSVPVAYCRDCYPIAKIDSWASIYSITIMIVLLDLMMAVVFGVVGWRQRQAGGH